MNEMKYKNTKSNRLLKKHGEDWIKQIGEKLGYRKAADYFGTSIAVMRNIVKQNNGTRSVAYTPNILKAVQNGKKSPQDYPHIQFHAFAEQDNSMPVKNLIADETYEITLISPDKIDAAKDVISRSNTSVLLHININSKHE